jgi:chlorite dismutase
VPLPITRFVGGSAGPWQVERIAAVFGPPLEPVERILILDDGGDAATAPVRWVLRGVASYERYVTRAERNELEARQPALGRPEATCAALIPVAKSPGWWNLPADERRAIFEERSAHITTGLRYLPAVARRLYQCRELGEPFDFLTWFEYAPADAPRFEELVTTLRRSEEWRYVEREVDIRLRRAALTSA